MTAEQLGLIFDEPASRGVCCHGTYILSPCRQCAEEVDRLCAAFAEDVKAGKHDAEGYTPADRRAQVKRAAQRAAELAGK